MFSDSNGLMLQRALEGRTFAGFLRCLICFLASTRSLSLPATKLMGGEPEAAVGVGDAKGKEKKLAFVTVGTTLFDALVRAVDAAQVKRELSAKGYTHLLIQIGRGSYIPSRSTGEDGSIEVDYFTFSSSIAESLKSASLVISHAGSGSIFESLRLGKPLIVVVNEDLMDNHQAELAEELAERKHLFCARPQTLQEIIADMNVGSLRPYPLGDAKPVAKHINRFLGFPDD